MTTRKELITVKYNVLEVELKKYINNEYRITRRQELREKNKLHYKKYDRARYLRKKELKKVI